MPRGKGRSTGREKVRYNEAEHSVRVHIWQDRITQVVQWFISICDSATSDSLVIEVRGFYVRDKICDKIQDTLLALHERIETFSAYLTPGTKEQGLFSKLYDEGIVVEEEIEESNKPVEFKKF